MPGSASTLATPKARAFRIGSAVALAMAAFCACYFLLSDAYYRFVDARFPKVAGSVGLATLWGIVSRAYLVVLLIPFALWRPRLLGLKLGQTVRRYRMLLGMLVANCGVIAGYLLLTRSATPYSGNEWAITEILTVPLLEELLWRGLLFTALLLLLRRWYPENASMHFTVWLTGVGFGLLHAQNALAGVPLAFVLVQVLNASVWGVVYGYARARTQSVLPPILLHAAMNAVIVLW